MIALGGLALLFIAAMAAAAVAYYGSLGVCLVLLWIGKAVFRVR